MVIQTKTVRIFLNNKPWITKELKGILNEKKHAFLNGDCTSVRGLNKEFRSHTGHILDLVASQTEDNFYARYDNTDYSNECDVLCQTMSSSPVTLVESDVVRCFHDSVRSPDHAWKDLYVIN